MNEVSVFAPATVANVAVGFDILGFSLDIVGDEVTLVRIDSPNLEIAPIEVRDSRLPKEWFESLSRDPRKNTATIGLAAFMKDKGFDFGFRVQIKKGIPLKSGMGGSAASGVAALVAANHFLPVPLSRVELLSYAVLGEAFTSGSPHPDNVSPCLFGGLTVTRSVNPVDVVAIPVPQMVICVIVHPHLELDTKTARDILQKEITLASHVRQSSNLAGFIAACYTQNLFLLRSSFQDEIIEPQRAKLVPHFYDAKSKAMDHGALGCSLSGSGPSLFAWFSDPGSAHAADSAMCEVFKNNGIGVDSWMSAISHSGARIMSAKPR